MGPAAVRAEEADGGLLGVGPRLPLVEYPGMGRRDTAGRPGRPVALDPAVVHHQRLLLPAGKGHDGFKEGGNVRPQLIPHQSSLGSQHLLFPRHVQHRQAMGGLIFPYLPGYRHALAEQLGDLPVDLVNLGAQALQIFHYRYNSLSLT